MSMEAKRTVAESLTSAEEAVYGFDAPRSSLTVNGETILFGADAPGGEGVYVMKQGSPAVYLVAPYTAEPYLKPATSLVSLNLTAAPDAEFTGFANMTLSGSSFPEPIVMRRTEQPENTAGTTVSYSTHEITSPIQASVTTGEASQRLTTVYGLVAQGVAAVADDAETLKAHGLDAPAAVMDVTADKPEHTFTLSASAPQEDGTVYVQKKGQPIIYKLGKDQLPWMELTAFELMDKFANMANIETVKNLKITVSDMIYEFNLEGKGDDMVVTYLNGDVLDLKNFRRFYQTVISARYSEELTTEEVSLASSAMPLLQFFFEYNDGRPQDVVRFLPSSVPLRCVIRVNDGPAYLCEERYVQIVSEDVHKAMLGEEVKAYF
jgi:hypothetical protein